MDAVLTTLISAAPQAGGAGLLLGVLILLVRREAQASERWNAELTRVNAAHDAELAELRIEIKALREQVTDLNLKLDEERARRRQAEDVASWSAGTGDEQWRP